eukprot:1748322-Pleurochrysis_carterae.AAC.1
MVASVGADGGVAGRSVAVNDFGLLQLASSSFDRFFDPSLSLCLKQRHFVWSFQRYQHRRAIVPLRKSESKRSS